MRKLKISALILCIFLLTGCQGFSVPEGAGQITDILSGMEEEPDLSYEVPVSAPNILVNQLGYLTESAKIAVFKGPEVPESFSVVDAETGNTVFSGVPEDRGYNAGTDEYNSYGTFTALEKEGSYYIEAPVLGRSYTFAIGEELYEPVFKEACKQYYYNRCGMTLTGEFAKESAHNACHTGKAVLREDVSVSLDVSGGWHQDEKGQKDVAKAAKNIAVMLLAYELYGEAFTDAMDIPESGNGVPDILDEIKYEIEWLLKMQNQETGAVYSGVTVYEQSGNPGKAASVYVEPASLEAAKAYAMALSKFSYLYQGYDTGFATGCLKAADRAWKYAELNGEEETDAWKFAAAAELYRAAGRVDCHKYIIKYVSAGSYKKEQEEISLLGCVTYLSTKQKVNRGICEDMIKKLMAEAEKISRASKQSVYLTEGNREQDNNGQLLRNMMYLTIVNHIITNHEYETVIENHLHYFMGRNEKAICYIDNVGENNYKSIDNTLGIMKQFDADSEFIFMLSGILERTAFFAIPEAE